MAETSFLITVKHKGELPADVWEKAVRRIYDAAAARGIQADVSAKEWYALTVKEA